jgi:hypothetical protein
MFLYSALIKSVMSLTVTIHDSSTCNNEVEFGDISPEVKEQLIQDASEKCKASRSKVT